MGTELFLLSVSPDEVAKCKLQSSGSCKFFRKVASVFWLSASLFVSLNLLIVSSVVFYSFMKIFLLLGRYFQHFILCFSFQRDMWLDNLVHGNKTLTRNIPLSKYSGVYFVPNTVLDAGEVALKETIISGFDTNLYVVNKDQKFKKII